MAKEGWIAVRNTPLPVTSSLRNSKGLHKVLRSFFKRHRVCPRCDGHGITIEKKLETSPVETIKYEGIRSLERLKQEDDLNFGDVLREILLFQFAGREICGRCKGFRFIKRKPKGAA